MAPIDRRPAIMENQTVEVAMSVAELEKRVRALEEEVARLRRRLQGRDHDDRPWWEKVWGSFASDPAFEEAMRLGRQYRKSLKPKRHRRSRS